MSKWVSILVIVIGVLILVVSVGADYFGIGNSSGFGLKQILGAAIGIIAIIVGAWFAARKPATNSNPNSQNK